MKPSIVIPLLAALTGFGLGWLVKPPDHAPPAPPVAVKPTGKSSPDNPSAAGTAQSDPIVQPTVPDASQGPEPTGMAAEARLLHEKSAKARDTAKMLRLSEALGLTKSQQADLKKILADSQKLFMTKPGETPPGAKETLDLLVAGSTALEQSLATLLTPEQAASFADLRKRELANRVETQAQRELSRLTEITDLSAEQRDQLIAELRKSTATELAAIPAGLALLFDSSAIPLGDQSMPESAVLTLCRLSATPDPNNNDPAEAHARLMDDQRRKLNERLELLRGILTPAQLAQYQVGVNDHFAIQQMIRPTQP